MQHTLHTTHLEYDKSSFIVDLIAFEEDKLYVQISQQIFGTNQQQRLKINPTVLTDLIAVLQQYQQQIAASTQTPQETSPHHFSDKDQATILKRYMKGIPTEEIALHFNCETAQIEQILHNKGIPLTTNTFHPPQPKPYKYFRRRKKR
ncbi:MAG TPA: hypothetical protein DCM08_01115 [Microscillaceae bacterium]|jgi:hypothetical protein|nr:hypothetical protein [Microscillaceae bacterium]